jgi:hypothetical protein
MASCLVKLGQPGAGAGSILGCFEHLTLLLIEHRLETGFKVRHAGFTSQGHALQEHVCQLLAAGPCADW